MPGVYRKKNCPNCNKEHRKRGMFCSQGCHNSYREVSDTVRENAKKMGKENAGKPELIAAGHLLKQGIHAEAEDFAIQIPTLYDLPDGYTTDDFR